MSFLNTITDKFWEFNLSQELNSFDKAVKDLLNKEFKNFGECEIEYCKLINAGNNIRKYILKNPKFADENSLKFLSNKSQDENLLNKKFKSLLGIHELTKSLIKHYQEYAKEQFKGKKYHDVVNIYMQMFNLTGNYVYKINAANILYKFLSKPETSLKIYKETEKYFGEEPFFIKGIANIYWDLKDYYKQVFYMKKLIDKEMNNLESV